MSILEILIGAVFFGAVRSVVRSAIARSQRPQKAVEAPAEPAPVLGVVIPRQRDGRDLADRTPSI